MKKYLFGILALVLAVGFSAFTTKKQTTFDMLLFSAPSTTDQSLIQDEDEWQYVGKVAVVGTTCPISNFEACELVVDERDTNYGSVTNPESNKNLVEIAAARNIVATLNSASSGYFVSSYTKATGSQTEEKRNEQP